MNASECSAERVHTAASLNHALNMDHKIWPISGLSGTYTQEMTYLSPSNLGTRMVPSPLTLACTEKHWPIIWICSTECPWAKWIDQTGVLR